MERQGRMKFDEKRYLEEMRDLIDRAIAAFEARPEKPVVYTVSIWTDPDAAASAVCIDTEVNSQRFVAGVNEYNRVKREQFLADGDEKMAKLFGVATRNCSPADFAFRDRGMRSRIVSAGLERGDGRPVLATPRPGDPARRRDRATPFLAITASSRRHPRHQQRPRLVRSDFQTPLTRTAAA